jgi:two-component system chemotaxis sensor kinase CheA
LEVADDGRGINLEEIRQAAIQKGFLRSDQASTASGQELLDLLFLPGFSTAAAVTEVSGRGIGLNIVKVRIEALRGSVELKSTSNQGTRFLLRFPPTMAIVEVLLVRVRKEFFAIPMVDVAEVLEVDRAKFNNSNIMVSRGKTITLVDLAQSLGLTNGKAPAEGPAYVLTSSFSSGNNGLMVDEVTGRQPIVIKSVGLILNQVAPFSGATILGDGRVVLILDLHTLLADKVARPIAEGGIRHGAGSTALIAPAAIKKKR